MKCLPLALASHVVQAEVAKPADEKGAYLYPQGYGQPEELGLDYQHRAPLDPVREATPPSAGDGE